MSEYQEEARSSREWVNFIILALVLVGAVVVVALARPLIFGRIVPAVMGEGLPAPTAAPVDNVAAPEEPTPEIDNDSDEAVEEDDAVVEPTAVPEVTEGEAAADEGETADAPAEEAPSSEGDEASETATPAVVTHTVKAGETLRSIAQQYGITVQQIIAANTLANPDYIRVGDTLIIPAAE